MTGKTEPMTLRRHGIRWTAICNATLSRDKAGLSTFRELTRAAYGMMPTIDADEIDAQASAAQAILPHPFTEDGAMRAVDGYVFENRADGIRITGSATYGKDEASRGRLVLFVAVLRRAAAVLQADADLPETQVAETDAVTRVQNPFE